jgi:hypothetical protein
MVAVFVSALVAFLLGWLWYSDKMFGPAWKEAIGKTHPEEEGEGLAKLAVNFGGWLVTAFCYGLIVKSSSVFGGIQGALWLSVILWAAFFMPTKSMAIFNGNFSTKLIWIDGLYILSCYVLMGICFAAFA